MLHATAVALRWLRSVLALASPTSTLRARRTITLPLTTTLPREAIILPARSLNAAVHRIYALLQTPLLQHVPGWSPARNCSFRAHPIQTPLSRSPARPPTELELAQTVPFSYSQYLAILILSGVSVLQRVWSRRVDAPNPLAHGMLDTGQTYHHDNDSRQTKPK